MKCFFASLVLLFSLTANALDSMSNTKWFIRFADWSGTEFEIKPDYEEHTGPIEKILIGHMVTGPFLPAGNKLKKTLHENKLVYNVCFGLDGKCYEARPFNIKPALLRGYNDKSCGVGLIANTCKDGSHLTADRSVVIDDLVKRSWARMLAHLSLTLNLGELVWGKNITGQRDLNPAQFPYSPGPKFDDHRDEIINLANEFIKFPKSSVDGELLP